MSRDFEDQCWKDIMSDEVLDIYEPYRRETRVGRNPAVLAIDLYNKAYQGGSRPVREVNRRYEVTSEIGGPSRRWRIACRRRTRPNPFLRRG